MDDDMDDGYHYGMTEVVEEHGCHSFEVTPNTYVTVLYVGRLAEEHVARHGNADSVVVRHGLTDRDIDFARGYARGYAKALKDFNVHFETDADATKDHVVTDEGGTHDAVILTFPGGKS